MPVGPVTYNTKQQFLVQMTELFFLQNLTLAESQFVDGTNTIAVEIHSALQVRI
jgi:hypothetical protein